MRAIIQYITDRNPKAAERLLSRIDACTQRIAAHPFLYRPGRLADLREAVVEPNYILVYRVGGDTVEIVGVLHSRRLYPPGAER